MTTKWRMLQITKTISSSTENALRTLKSIFIEIQALVYKEAEQTHPNGGMFINRGTLQVKSLGLLDSIAAKKLIFWHF